MEKEGLIGESLRMIGSARDELKKYYEDRDPTHIRQASEKGWSAVALTTDYLFARLGVIEYVQSRIPERSKSWHLFTHERRALLRELRKHIDAARELETKFGYFAYNLHAWGFYEGAIDVDDLKEMLSEVEEYVNEIRGILPELERRKEELYPILIKGLEARWKTDEELARQRQKLMEKYLKDS
jgi:hypothetical protein